MGFVHTRSIRFSYIVVLTAAFAAILFFGIRASLAAQTPVSLVSTGGFMGNVGVNIHMWETSAPYGNVTSVETALSYLGINNVRDNFWSSDQPALASLAGAGYKLDLAIAPASEDIPTYVSLLDAFVKAHPSSVASIEGPNEIDIWPPTYNGGTTVPDAALYQKAFYTAVRADTSFNAIPVFNLTVGSLNTAVFTALGNLSSAADYGNIHPYQNDAYRPEWSFDIIFPVLTDSPGLPTVVTETGYTTNTNDGYSGASQTADAKSLLDSLFDLYKNKSVVRTFVYELFDDASDPSLTNSQYHYGLFNFDGTPKTAATAIHNLSAIMGNAAGATGLSYSIANLQSTGYSALFQKSSGAYDIVVWNDAAVWSPSSKSDITVPATTVTVTLPQSYANVSVFDPMVGSTAINTYSNVSQVPISVSDHPVIVEVGGSGTPTGPDPHANSHPRACSRHHGPVRPSGSFGNSDILVGDESRVERFH